MQSNDLQAALKSYLEKHPDQERFLADQIGVSLPTILRWLEGENLPHDNVIENIVSNLSALEEKAPP